MDASRQCVKCWVEKPASAFAKDPRVASGLNARCRDCFNADRKRRYADDPEAGRQRSRDWREANPEKVRETAERHWQRNHVAIRRQALEYHYRNREARLVTMRAYHEANRENIYRLNAEWRATPAGQAAINAASRRRRAAKANLPREMYSLDEIVLRDGLVCCLCEQPIDPAITERRWTLTVEHHIPLQGDRTLLEELGLAHPGDVLANVGLAHYGCNSTKRHRYTEADVARYLSNVEAAAA